MIRITPVVKKHIRVALFSITMLSTDPNMGNLKLRLHYNGLTGTHSSVEIIMLRVESVPVISPLHCEDVMKQRYAYGKCEIWSL